jgi:hypothetical protein
MVFPAYIIIIFNESVNAPQAKQIVIYALTFETLLAMAVP